MVALFHVPGCWLSHSSLQYWADTQKGVRAEGMVTDGLKICCPVCSKVAGQINKPVVPGTFCQCGTTKNPHNLFLCRKAVVL